MIEKPRRHAPSPRNRKKALKFATELVEELEYLDTTLRAMTDEHIRYALGRARRLVNRLKAESENDEN